MNLARAFSPLFLVLLTCLCGAIGCEPSTTNESRAAVDGLDTSGRDATLKVVCTTGQVGDMLTNLGGQHVSVETLMGPGVDPHLYRGTLSDSRKLSQADAVFYNGLHLEGRLAEVLENLAERKPVFAVTEGLIQKFPEQLRKPPEFSGAYDPHVWFDVSLWTKCAESASARLIELDPKHADDYRQLADQYLQKLNQLHATCRQRLAEIPPQQRVLVTAHDAFGYFGKAYDVEVHGLQGISTADEADLGSINKLVDLLVDRQVKAVFVESSVPPKNIESLIQGCAARGHVVIEGGELFSDALGSAGTPEATYIGAVEHNLNTIVNALR